MRPRDLIWTAVAVLAIAVLGVAFFAAPEKSLSGAAAAATPSPTPTPTVGVDESSAAPPAAEDEEVAAAPKATATSTSEAPAAAGASNPQDVGGDLVAPVLDEEQSWPPEAGAGSFDLGVLEDQVSLVFGVEVAWPAGGLSAGGSGCALVLLESGFYPDLRIIDGRYEVYTLPTVDQDGWKTVLVTERAAEQAAHYGCPEGVSHVRVWAADPHETSWADRRRASGIDYLIPFSEGDEVYGYAIWDRVPTYEEGVGHSPTPICDGGGCYLPQAPFAGACGGCVINSWWPGEIPPDARSLDLD